MELIDKVKNITNEKNIYTNEPMSKHTSFQTGGPADIFVVPETKQEIIELLQLDAPITVIGNGSNLLVKDGGIRGIVIKVATKHYELQDNMITADAGCSLIKLSHIAFENSLSGLEFACGIPGSLGGALVMNAGAYGGEIGNLVLETEVCDYKGNISKITEHEFGYRSSIFQRKDFIILSSKLQLQHGDKEQIKTQMDSNMKARREKQPIDKHSAGSTFKRPKDNFAAKLIQDAGLKGYAVGDAMISDLHSGFVINNGKATSKEILALIRHVQERVNAEYGVMLEPEIRIIGED